VNAFLAIVREVVALDNDSKTFISNYLGKFLLALDDVLKISKDKRIDAEIHKYLIEQRVLSETQQVNESLISMI
jgi:hypothetical protein